ncbi:type I restriction enzyme, S subunit [Gracilibacillus orientalis]|uniref:Type I restriction enzyme, S subunit n=1 Tax=Gracilibacillus orientalis TaxID=334253 RepID=A0A1I4J3W5_9BACI|nr:restriction endonuclease subunit S [Gracilibacillus orientalis]SFL61264.1 type I restriction enzyme, S subunit [Gracilibacillus orientalis]
MKNKQTPDLRFSDFSGDWEQRKFFDNIKSIVDFRGRTPKKLGLEWSDSGYLALSALNVKDGYIDPSADAHYGDEELYQKWMGRKELKQGQVLFTTEAPMGNVAQVPDNKGYILSQRTIAFNVDENKIIDDFLSVLLRSPKVFNELSSLSSGGTAKGVSQKSLSQLKVKVPQSLEEQKKIGELLNQLDNTIALHQQELDTLKQTKQGFLQKMFPKEGESVPEIRFPSFTGNWEEHKLKDIVDLLKDGTHGTHKNGKGAFLLSAKNIKNGQIIIDELVDRKISADDYNSIFKNYKLMNEDLLITIVGTIGQTALYTEFTSKIAFQRSVAIIRGNEDINQNFLKSTIDSCYVQKQLVQSASMSAQAGVYLGDLEKLTINIPELSEQTKIGNFFKQLDDTIALHEQELDTLKQTKKAFLQKMFV